MSNDSLVELIKKIAVNAVEASTPCNIITDAIVMSTKPLKVVVDNVLALDDDFVELTETAKNNIKEGKKALLIRQSGGEKYVMIDMLNEGGGDT